MDKIIINPHKEKVSIRISGATPEAIFRAVASLEKNLGHVAWGSPQQFKEDGVFFAFGSFFVDKEEEEENVLPLPLPMPFDNDVPF